MKAHTFTGINASFIKHSDRMISLSFQHKVAIVLVNRIAKSWHTIRARNGINVMVVICCGNATMLVSLERFSFVFATTFVVEEGNLNKHLLELAFARFTDIW